METALHIIFWVIGYIIVFSAVSMLILIISDFFRARHYLIKENWNDEMDRKLWKEDRND